MLRSIIDLSAVLCTVAGVVGCMALVRTRSGPSWDRVLGVPYIFLAAAMILASLYVRSPFSLLRVRLVVTALCLAPAPWLFMVLAWSEQDLAAALARWRAVLLIQATGSAGAAALMWAHGVDWVTGIGSEPAVVLTRWGLVAVTVGATPGCAALAILARRFRADAATMPSLWVSAVGTICSLTWISATLVGRGYLSVTLLESASVLAGMSAAVGAVAVLQTASVSHPFAPSRRLIYGASVATLIAAYLIAARFAVGWIANSAAAIPEVLPAVIFAAVGGLVVSLGSPRWRHRLWVAVGRHLFRAKHDYGEVWIRLAKLVATARDAPSLVQQAAEFCRDLLCVPEVSVWLVDSAGRPTRAAQAPQGLQPAQPTLNMEASSDTRPNPDSTASAGRDVTVLMQAAGPSFAYPMRVNGRQLGWIAVGSPMRPVQLDEEDRRLVRYVSAELASALGLYRLGEEIAEVRQVESFHRVSGFILHDLKNLVAQQSFVLENAGRFRSDPTFISDALAAFEDSTNRMRSLMSRLRSGQAGDQLTHAPCDLLEVVREVIAMPRVAAGCAVRLIIPADIRACPVVIDQAALTQLFTNLLVNAVESLPAGAGEVALSIARAVEGWRVEVRDNGRGIPEAFLRDRLFRPLQTTKETGWGIGLYQCKTIVDAAGGTISVSSAEGAGTTVVVTLPTLVVSQRGGAASIGAHHGEADRSGC